MALTPAHLAKLPMPEDLLPHIDDTQRITSHVAHKRQLAFLAKQMRRESDETLDAIRDALEVGGDAAARDGVAAPRRGLARASCWTRATTRWPNCSTESRTPTASTCASWCATRGRNAKNKPPHAFRELFRELRELLVQPMKKKADER